MLGCKENYDKLIEECKCSIMFKPYEYPFLKQKNNTDNYVDIDCLNFSRLVIPSFQPLNGLFILKNKEELNKMNDFIIEESLLNRLRGLFTPTSSDQLFTPKIEDIKNILNTIFPTKKCKDVIYTLNTDNRFFGIIVYPLTSYIKVTDIIFGSGDVNINEYELEIDSKLFNIGLTPDEIVAYMLFEVSNLMFYINNSINELRNSLDMYQAKKDTYMQLDNSLKNISVLAFAISDSLFKLSSVLYQDINGLISNNVLNSNELTDYLLDGLRKIKSSVFGIDTAIKDPNLSQLKWALELYSDVEHSGPLAIETLKDAMCYTGSVIYKNKIKKIINDLSRTNNYVVKEATKLLKEVEDNGLFKDILTEAKGHGFINNMKRGGLRSIEDDLYEFTIRVKNADTEEDAYYALRQINSRINMLEEYIYANESSLSESEINHWRSVSNQYKSLRASLSNKKIVHQKSYGLFFDYDQLDNM